MLRNPFKTINYLNRISDIFNMWEYLFGLLLFINLYRHLSIFLIRRRSKKPVQIMKGSEPFLLSGGKKGVLFLHGFTCTPREGRDLGSYLNKKGYTFYAPLLPGHGTSPERLCMVKWDDWIKATREALNTLEKTCSEIYVVGNSLGGNLAFCVEDHPKVKGIVCMGTAFIFKKHWRWTALFTFLRHFKIFQKKKYTKEIRKLHEKRKHISYSTVPVVSLTQGLKVLKESKKKLPKITKPICIMQSKTDPVTHPSSAQYIYEKVKSKQKSIVWMDESYHNLVVDEKRTKVFKEIYGFIR